MIIVLFGGVMITTPNGYCFMSNVMEFVICHMMKCVIYEMTVLKVGVEAKTRTLKSNP